MNETDHSTSKNTWGGVRANAGRKKSDVHMSRLSLTIPSDLKQRFKELADSLKLTCSQLFRERFDELFSN